MTKSRLGQTPRPLAERFWEKVDVLGKDDCWLWLAYKGQQGYGVMTVNGNQRLATHVLFYLRHGYWSPKGRTANHHCDNPSCLNPKHLYLGTNKSNTRDMVQRGRHGMAKLTVKQVRKIRSLYSDGSITLRKLGHRFGVAQSQVSLIVNNKSWGHLEGGQ